jgi:hypothetical protein
VFSSSRKVGNCAIYQVYVTADSEHGTDLTEKLCYDTVEDTSEVKPNCI